MVDGIWFGIIPKCSNPTISIYKHSFSFSVRKQATTKLDFRRRFDIFPKLSFLSMCLIIILVPTSFAAKIKMKKKEVLVFWTSLYAPGA